MSNSTRLFLSLSEEEFASFERARNELGFNRSQYLRYLIGGQKEIRPVSMQYKDLISKLSSIDRSLKAIAMSDALSYTDRMMICTKLEELKDILGQKF